MRVTILASLLAATSVSAFQGGRPALRHAPRSIMWRTASPQTAVRMIAHADTSTAAPAAVAAPMAPVVSPARRLRRLAAVGVVSAVAVAATTANPAWAANAAATAEEHLHLGQKVAQFFRGFGLADEAVITIISAMPVVELRGAIPVGIWMGLPMAKVFALCVVGNMLPIAPLLFALRFGPVQSLMKPILDRAQAKAEAAFSDPKSRAVLLAAFVGIPLPGTGAWTGAMGAFLLGMPFAQAMAAIFAGVLTSGCIMTAISQGGKVGAAVGAVLLGSMLTQVGGGKKKEDPPAAE